LTLATTFLGILGRGTHSSSTSITTVSKMAFGSISNFQVKKIAIQGHEESF